MINAENIRNIAFAGHNGSGKTSLVEAILYNAQVTDRIGKHRTELQYAIMMQKK